VQVVAGFHIFSVICCVLPQFGAFGFKINLQESAAHIKNHIIKEAIAKLASSFDPLIEDPRVCC